MKKKIMMVAMAASVAAVSAQEQGKVISSVPMVQSVAVPKQVCRTENVAVQQPSSGAGAVMGAIAGGVIGNAVGDGAGRAAATMIGVVGGSAIGDQIEGSGNTTVQQVQRCELQTSYENQIVGYRVTYTYAGKTHTVEMPSDPGKKIDLQVLPAGTAGSSSAGVAVTGSVPVPYTVSTPIYQQPVYTSPVRVYWGIGGWPMSHRHH